MEPVPGTMKPAQGAMTAARRRVTQWLAARGFKPFAFQREVWEAIAQGRGGLLHATTGSGKTYAVWLGLLAELLRRHPRAQPAAQRAEPLRVLWLTPMRALAADTARALAEPLSDLAPAWTLGQRTGDTPGAERARQDRRMPTALVTTPESLTLMLTREAAREELATVSHVVVDEWHELIGSKRGVQAQLAIARLRRFNPALVVWGLSATLGNLEEAMQVLCGEPLPDAGAGGPAPRLVRGRIDKTLVIDTLIPPDPGKYSWAGHLGARMQQPVVDEIARSGTTLAFCERGGQSLAAYPDYHRIVRGEDGTYRVPDRAIARRHKLAVGTIVSEASIQVKYMSGARIGTMEEGFIARLRQGDCFFFAGRLLEFIRVQDMAAYVKKATRKSGTVPTWAGSKMALSPEMGGAVLRMMQAAAQGDFVEPELQAARPMLQTQMRLSRLPTPDTLLVERFHSREGMHLYIYPFAGRHVHLGLASLLAWRLAKGRPNTFSMSVNDYGFELVSAQDFDPAPVLDRTVFDARDLLADVLASLNSTELAQRRFREIARVAGLVFTGYPGQPRSARQLQASSGLFFEVFRKYDKDNLLLGQAQQEVLSQELDIARLRAALAAMMDKTLDAVLLRHPSPMSLPLMVERFREKFTTQQLSDRLDRILRDMERDGD